MSIKIKRFSFVSIFSILFIAVIILLIFKDKRLLQIKLCHTEEKADKLVDHITNEINPPSASDYNNNISQRDIFIYRFSDDMCENCVFEDLTCLRQFQKEIGYKKILVLPAYKEDRNSQIRLFNRLKGFQFKNIPEDAVSFPTYAETNLKNRFFAYIDTAGMLKRLFIPIKGETDLTQIYFTKIKESYFTKAPQTRSLDNF